MVEWWSSIPSFEKLFWIVAFKTAGMKLSKYSKGNLLKDEKNKVGEIEGKC